MISINRAMKRDEVMNTVGNVPNKFIPIVIGYREGEGNMMMIEKSFLHSVLKIFLYLSSIYVSTLNNYV